MEHKMKLKHTLSLLASLTIICSSSVSVIACDITNDAKKDPEEEKIDLSY